MFDLALRRAKQVCLCSSFGVDQKYFSIYCRTIRVRFSTFTKEYALSIYWSSLTMTTLGEQPSPNETFQSVFEILDTIIGLVVFAAIMGSVGDLVANANKIFRELDPELQQRVLKYCEYEMGKQEMMKEGEMRDFLPSKLYIHVNKSIQWTTLAKSKLLEEMYIVSSGMLRSVDANGFPIESFNEGDILGDRSLVWFLHNRFRNRRHRAVISQGYSKVYMLYRDDFLDVLVDYPSLKEYIWRKAQELQFRAGELVAGAKMCESNEYEDSPLEQRLTEMRTKIETIERSINQNYERFKVQYMPS
uniref:Cyclic nucleotide-binding domain-containing protein n=1 Tax=Heterorhabditis bacteriophora TaxID=37862 RepID=A0A1I7X882_HETBA